MSVESEVKETNIRLRRIETLLSNTEFLAATSIYIFAMLTFALVLFAVTNVNQSLISKYYYAVLTACVFGVVVGISLLRYLAQRKVSEYAKTRNITIEPSVKHKGKR